MRRYRFFDLPPRHESVLQRIQSTWTHSGPIFRQSNPKWKEGVWRKEFRDFLARIQAGTCAFCETYILGGWHGEVEHFLPKAVYHEHKFRWRNWVLSCKNCNTAKNLRDPRKKPWMNPRSENPIHFLSVLITGKLVPKAGLQPPNRFKIQETIDGADLNCERTKRSASLKEQRMSAIAKASRLARLLDRGSDPVLIRGIRHALVELCGSPETPFGGVLRIWLRGQPNVDANLVREVDAYYNSRLPTKAQVFL